MSLRSVFSGNVRFFRKQKGFSQQQLAELCNIATNYVSEIETGRKVPSIELIERIAQELNVEPCILFMDSSNVKLCDVQKSEYIYARRNQDFVKELKQNLDDVLRKYDFTD